MNTNQYTQIRKIREYGYPKVGSIYNFEFTFEMSGKRLFVLRDTKGVMLSCITDNMVEKLPDTYEYVTNSKTN